MKKTTIEELVQVSREIVEMETVEEFERFLAGWWKREMEEKGIIYK